MGVIIPQVITPSKASGAQVIDGSLKIVGDNDAHLTRTLTENGTKISSTFSFWIKRGDQGVGNGPAGYESFVDAYYSDDTYTRLYVNGNKLAMVTRVSDIQNYFMFEQRSARDCPLARWSTCPLRFLCPDSPMRFSDTRTQLSPTIITSSSFSGCSKVFCFCHLPNTQMSKSSGL